MKSQKVIFYTFYVFIVSSRFYRLGFSSSFGMESISHNSTESALLIDSSSEEQELREFLSMDCPEVLKTLINSIGSITSR